MGPQMQERIGGSLRWDGRRAISWEQREHLHVIFPSSDVAHGPLPKNLNPIPIAPEAEQHPIQSSSLHLPWPTASHCGHSASSSLQCAPHVVPESFLRHSLSSANSPLTLHLEKNSRIRRRHWDHGPLLETYHTRTLGVLFPLLTPRILCGQ